MLQCMSNGMSAILRFQGALDLKRCNHSFAINKAKLLSSHPIHRKHTYIIILEMHLPIGQHLGSVDFEYKGKKMTLTILLSIVLAFS